MDLKVGHGTAEGILEYWTLSVLIGGVDFYRVVNGSSVSADVNQQL